jgi:two-component system nitrate/nitrite response regulator NarL
MEAARQQRFRLVLADDNPDVLDELRRLLDLEFDVLSAVTDGHSLIQAVAERRPDAVVSDIQMPGLSGIEAGEQIVRQGLCNAVLVLTMYNEQQLVGKAIQAGIRGYVLKVDASEELIPAIHTVLGGGRYLSQAVSEKWGK